MPQIHTLLHVSDAEPAERIDPELPLYSQIMRQIPCPKPHFLISAAHTESFAEAFDIFPKIPLSRKEDHLYSEPGRQERQIQHDLRPGHILVYQINAVPRGITQLKFVVARAARAASHMADDSLRDKIIAVAGDPCTVRNVDILQISKMRLVEQTDLIKNFSAIDRRSGAGRENLALCPIPFCRLPCPRI